MYIRICTVLVALCLCIRDVQLQVAVTDVSKRPVCDQSIQLRCTYSGGLACCSSDTRIWKKGTVQIMSDGTPFQADKYREDINGPSKYFDLFILNPDDTDYDDYSCEYGFSTSTGYTVKKDDEKRGECAGKDFGSATIGTVIAIIIVLIIACILLNNKLHVVVVIVVSFFISEAANAVIAVPIGYFVAHCNCKPGLEYTFILLGLATAGVPGAILIFYKNR